MPQTHEYFCYITYAKLANATLWVDIPVMWTGMVNPEKLAFQMLGKNTSSNFHCITKLGYYHIGSMTETLEEQRSAEKEINFLNPFVFRSLKTFQT